MYIRRTKTLGLGTADRGARGEGGGGPRLSQMDTEYQQQMGTCGSKTLHTTTAATSAHARESGWIASVVALGKCGSLHFVCCVTQETCLLRHTADMSAVSHSRHVPQHPQIKVHVQGEISKRRSETPPYMYICIFWSWKARVHIECSHKMLYVTMYRL